MPLEPGTVPVKVALTTELMFAALIVAEDTGLTFCCTLVTEIGACVVMLVPTGVTTDTPDTLTLAAAVAMEVTGNAPEMALLTVLPMARAAKRLLSTFTGAPAKLDAAVKVAELPAPGVPPVVLVLQEVVEEASP